MSRVGLTGHFDVTVGADGTKAPKPSKDIFLYALKKLNVSPQEAIFVGDDLKKDYEGSRNAELKPLLIDREDIVKKRIRKIRDLREVIKYI